MKKNYDFLPKIIIPRNHALADMHLKSDHPVYNNSNKTSHIKILYEKFVENIQVHYIKLKNN